jgi:hypothetical protein
MVNISSVHITTVFTFSHNLELDQHCQRSRIKKRILRSLFVLVLFLLVIILSFLPRFTSSDYPFGIFWYYPFGIFWLPLWYLLITPLVSSDYPFGIFWLPLWYLLITPLVSSDYSFGIFWLPLWYLLITPLLSSDYPFVIFCLPLCFLQAFLPMKILLFLW